AEPQQEFGLDSREAALEDGKAHDLPGAGLADAAREDRPREAIVLEHRGRVLADEAHLPAGDRVLNEPDGGVLTRVGRSEVGRQRAGEAGQRLAALARGDEALRDRLGLGAEGASAGLFEHQEPFPSTSVDAGQGMGNRCHYQYTGLPSTWRRPIVASAVTAIVKTLAAGLAIACVALPDAAEGQRQARQSAPLAFPGAVGWAATTPGGRGGRIVKVTTLANEGDGSLRAALALAEPRIIVFEVGGVIDLERQTLRITEPNVTIAGQTAPSPGITLIEGGIDVLTHDVVLQHIRVRTGEAGQPKAVDGGNWGEDAL